MQNARTLSIVSSHERHRWCSTEPRIWSALNGSPMDHPARSILRTLWDRPRWLEAHHLYDERGSDLFERICELPEYYLTRTENAILAKEAENVIAAAPVECIVELGAGSAKKTMHLLQAQSRQRGRGIFAPIDVSLPGLLTSRDELRASFPRIDFYGLHARYEDGFANLDNTLPKLFVFLGSTIGNFPPSAFVRFFNLLSHAMGPGDYLLLGADRVKDIDVMERAYADSQGLTAEFILNVFSNINRHTGSNFEPASLLYHSWYNPEWAQIEMYAIASRTREIFFPSAKKGFVWQQGERILVEISRKFDPLRLQEQLGFFDLQPVGHYTDDKQYFSLLLFKKVNPQH